MESIIKWLQTSLLETMPEWDLAPLAGKVRGKLRLSPEQLLHVIHAQSLAEWALGMAHGFAPASVGEAWSRGSPKIPR